MDYQSAADSLRTLKTLTWIQAGVGAALGAGVFVAATGWAEEPYAVALMGCVVLWMFGFRGLRRRAALLEPGPHPDPPAIPRGILLALGFAELASAASWLWGNWGSLVVPANLLAGGTIALHLLTCNALDLPVHRRSWGTVLLILAVGTVWNTVGVIALYTWWQTHRF